MGNKTNLVLAAVIMATPAHAQTLADGVWTGVPPQYRYAESIFLGVGTDFGRFVTAVAGGTVYYDPGIKLGGALTSKPRTHRRSQFRISFKKIPVLYRSFVLSDPT